MKEQIITTTTTIITTTVTTGNNQSEKPVEKPKPKPGYGEDGQILPQWA